MGRLFTTALLGATLAFAGLVAGAQPVAYADDPAGQAADAAQVSLSEDPTNRVDPRQTPDNSFLYDTSIAELAAADSSSQGKTVQVTGEVVGDALISEEDEGKHWITLEALGDGDDSSISVLIDDSYLDLIDAYGTYGTTGTILQVRGVYYLTCPSHEGIMDIHAESVKIVSRGARVERPLQESLVYLGTFFVALGIALTLVYNRLRERAR